MYRTVDFDQRSSKRQPTAFNRFGKGEAIGVNLNFGDCMAYAVATGHDVPLLFKGNDFSHTDITPALP